MPLNLRSRVSRGVRVAIALTAAAAALSPAAGQAFTLIQGTTKLFVNPKAGYTTSLVQVRGTFTIAANCTGIPLNFAFQFDGKPLWSKSIATCTASAWDTGWSPYQQPPVAPTVGNHLIALKVTNPNNNGATVGTASFAYAIYPAPASPQTRPTPTPTPTPTPDCSAIPVPAGCPSPTAKSCPAAMLPPGGTGGWGDNLIAALMVGAALPIAGLALFGPQTLLAEARRRRRFLILFGLSALAVLALNCTFPTASTSQPTPGVPATPTPTASSCSA